MPRPSCSRCQRPLGHCLCASIPALDSRTHVLILQHPSEAGHALNTARLAALGLRNAALHVGERFDLPALLPPGHRPCLLFPGEGAVEVTPALTAAETPPLCLVVPDGTWRKASRLLHLDPRLAALPRLHLPDGLSSRYRLRKAPRPGALSTVEAIVVALNCLEAPRRFEALLAPFERLIEGQIEAMGETVYRRNHCPD